MRSRRTPVCSGALRSLTRQPWTPLVLVGVVVASCDDGTPSTGGAGGGSTSVSTASSTVASTSSGPLPAIVTVTGVVTDGKNPLAGAFVMQGGGTPTFVTGPDGAFTLDVDTTQPGTPTVVAGKIGYRSTGEEILFVPTEPLVLAVLEVSPPDNAGYVFGKPGVGDPALDNNTSLCGHCHTRYVADFQTSGHARATRDPLVQDLYAGVATALTTQAACDAAGGAWRVGVVPGKPTESAAKCYVGRGVLPDLNPCGATKTCDDPTLAPAEKPKAFGQCADCHGAAIDGIAGGRNLHDATEVAYQNGNHCDACHHVRDVDMTSTLPGIAGRLVMQRPHEKKGDMPGDPVRQAMFGPLPDVPNFFMGGSWQPMFRSSEFCSGCHEHTQAALVPGSSLDAARWPDGLPTLSTFSEWQASSFNTPGTTCQFCHMPQIDDLFNAVDVSTAADAGLTFGFARTPDQLRSHIFQGPLRGTPRLIDSALAGSVTAVQNGTNLDVEVKLTNTGAGHAIPTSEPMRALVLLVRVTGCGEEFLGTSGLSVPDYGGAKATGNVGVEVAAGGASLTWAAGAAVAKVGDRVRVVRPTGAFLDYPGVGFFADPGLTPAQKGIEVQSPVGEASVLAVNGSAITLSNAISVAPGDVVYVGDAAPAAVVDADPSIALAGAPGAAFARVMVDPSGARFVPHYRAVDIVSDNRLPPQTTVTTPHGFAISAGCSAGHVTATLLYRPVPVALSRERAWDGRDYVVAEWAVDVTLD